MAGPETQPGEHVEKIRKYIESGLDEDDMLVLINISLNKAKAKHISIDVHQKFPDGKSLAGLAESKKLTKVNDYFSKSISPHASAKSTSINIRKQDAQSGLDLKKKQTSVGKDGKAMDAKKNSSQSHYPGAIAMKTPTPNENLGLRRFLHGITYQFKLSLIIFAHAYDLKQKDEKFTCTIASEDPDAGKFDDIVYKYCYKGVSNTICIQAKHKQNAYTIFKHDFFVQEDPSKKTLKNPPFALLPYFKSFLEMKQNDKRSKLTKSSSPNQPNLPIKEYVLATNASIDANLIPLLKSVERKENVEMESFFAAIKNPQSNQESCYKFDWQKLKSNPEFQDLVADLKAASCVTLAKFLASIIFKEEKLRTSAENTFKSAIVSNIVGGIRNKQPDTYDVTESFLQPATPDAAKFRAVFEEEYKKLCGAEIDVWEDVKTKGMKIPKGIMKDKEKLPNTPLPGDDTTDNEMEDFFEQFILACNTLNEEALVDQIKEQLEKTIAPQPCTDQVSSIATENAYQEMMQEVLDQIKCPNSRVLNESDIERLYRKIIYKMQFLQLKGVTEKRLVELRKSDIEIKRERLEASSFHSHLSSTDGNDWFLHRSHYDSGLVTKIVLHTLELKSACEYIFLDDESYWHLRPALEGIFLHLHKGITLVVECKNDTETSKLVEHSKEMLKNELTNHQQKVIFIQQIGAEEVRPDGADRFLVCDLTPESRDAIFNRHKNSHFFGTNAQLDEIIVDDDDLMYVFDLTTQSPLSKDVIDHRYIKIAPWFIDRTIKVGPRWPEEKKSRYRTSAQMKNFTDHALSLSTFCSELSWKLEKANIRMAKRYDVGNIIQKLRPQNTTSKMQEGYKMHFILDDPGCGKTTYLTWLAKELQQKHPCNWIISLVSIEYATEFAQLYKARKTIDRTVALRFLFELLYLTWHIPKINRQSIEETDPVRKEAKRCALLLTFDSSHKVFIDNREASTLDSLQLAHLRMFQKKYNDSKMMMLFDGFDEIAPNYKEVILDILFEYYSMPGIAKIYLTSRPNMFESDFQRLFPSQQLIFYHLEAFSERDQIVYLDKFLCRTLKEYAALQGTQDRYELLCILHNITEELVGNRKQIPLFMTISSELLLPLVQVHVTFAHHGITVSTDLIEEAKTLFEPQNMMKQFIDRKLYILHVEKTDATDSAYNIPATQSNAEELNKVKRRKHTLLAMYAMCDESEIDTLLEQGERTDALEYMRQVQLSQEKSGIVEAFTGHIPQFLHRSIAEFLMAEWIFNNRSKENVRTYLLSDQYWVYGKRVVRDYLNRIMASGSAIHQAVINQHSLEVEEILKANPGDANTLDAGGRTPLHLASEVGNLLQHQHKTFDDMFSQLLAACSATINQRDTFFRWTALEYALRSDSLQAIPMLIQHGVLVDAQVLAEQILYCSTDPYEILLRAAFYETRLWTKNGRYLDCVILTNRLVAQTLIVCENLNVYAPLGEQHMTAIQICTEGDAVELLKSLLLPNDAIDLAFNHQAVDVMDVLVTSRRDIPKTVRVHKETLEKCAQRGHTKLFEMLFQKYCQQTASRYNLHKQTATGQGNGLESLKHLGWYYFRDFYTLTTSDEMLPCLQMAVSNGHLAIVVYIITKTGLSIDNEMIKCLVLNAADEDLTDHEQLATVFKYLLDVTSDIRAPDSSGRTLLHCFVNLGYAYMARYLIERKAFSALTVNAMNGWNAFHYCIPHYAQQKKTEHYYCQIFSFMMEKEGAVGIHAIGLEGENVLHLAVTKRYFKIGKLIVASILENVSTEDAQRTLKQYLEQSKLSNDICMDFLIFLLEETDLHDDLKDVFASVRDFLNC